MGNEGDTESGLSGGVGNHFIRESTFSLSALMAA